MSEKGEASPSGRREGAGFEAQLGELEQIVARLESGDLSLEDSIAAFEKGVALVRGLHERLNEIEQRVETLTRDQQGNLHTQPFDETGKRRV